MFNKLPIWFLFVAAVAIGVFFFHLVRPFLLPLVFACVLAVLFWPVYRWMTQAFSGHGRIAAAVTTFAIVLVIMAPFGIGLTLVGYHLVEAAQKVSDSVDLENGEVKAPVDPENAALMNRLQELRSRFSQQEIQQAKRFVANGLTTATQAIYERTTRLMADLFSFFVGLFVMVLGLYYFFADKDAILGEVERLSPLDPKDDRELWDNFVNVCRGVLLGNVLAAVLQALLNGIGFLILGIESAWLLAFCTFFFSFIPFVGAGAVWFTVAIGLVIEQRFGAAGFLVVYGLLVVSSVDNVVRAFALRDTSRIHPLVALVSILGAIQVVGLWGIIVGPVTAAFFYAILNMLNNKLSYFHPDGQVQSQTRILAEPMWTPGPK